MKTYICQICGDAYIGEEAPADCPFCGAPRNYIKEGKEANPIVTQKIEVSELSKKNLMKAYGDEMKATAVYTCMAEKGKTYEIQKMFKRLAKVELEHAVIITKILGMPAPVAGQEVCNEEDQDNFQQTTRMEEGAVSDYKKFAEEATEENIRILFTALEQAEQGHIELMKNYLT